MTETDGRMDAEDEAEPHTTDEAAPGAEIGEAAPPLHRRIPWTYVVPLLLVASIWIGIALVCSPTDFRF